MRWWPRTVRWQLIVWLMLLEALSVGLFATILVNIEDGRYGSARWSGWRIRLLRWLCRRKRRIGSSILSWCCPRCA